MSHQEPSNFSQVYESAMKMARRAKQREEVVLISVRVENIMKSMMAINVEVGVRKREMSQIEETLKDAFKESNLFTAIKTQMLINDRANFHYQAGILFLSDNEKLSKLFSNWEELANLGKLFFADLRVKFQTWDDIYRFLKAASINVGQSCNSWKESFAVDETFKKSSDSLFNKIGLFRKLKAEYLVLDGIMKTYSQEVRSIIETMTHSANEKLQRNENINDMLKEVCLGQLYFYQVHGNIFQQHAYTDRITAAAGEVMSIINVALTSVSKFMKFMDDFNIAILMLAEKINYLCGVVFSLANVNKDIRTHFRYRNQIIDSSDYFEFQVPGLPITDYFKRHLISTKSVKTNERTKEEQEKIKKITSELRARLIEVSYRIPIAQTVRKHIEDAPIPESESYFDEDLEIKKRIIEEFLSEQALNECAEATTRREKKRNSKKLAGTISENKTVGKGQQDAFFMTVESKNENIPINKELDSISKYSCNETLKTTFKRVRIKKSDKKESSLASGEMLNETSCICKGNEISAHKDDEKTTQTVGKKKVSIVAKDTQRTLKEPLKKMTMIEPLPKVKKSRRKCSPMKLTKGKHNARRELVPMETQSANSELHLEKRTSSEVVTDETLSGDDIKLPKGKRRNQMTTQIRQMSSAEILLRRDKHGEQSRAREENKICPPDLDVELPINNCTDENSFHVEKTSPNSEMPHYKKESGELKYGDTSLPKTTTHGSSDANIVTRSRSKWSHDSEFKRGMPEHRSNAESLSQNIASETELPSICGMEGDNSKEKSGGISKVETVGEAVQAASSMTHNSVNEVHNSFVSEILLRRDKHGEQSRAREENKICPPDLDVELPINNFTDENSVHVEKTSPNSEMPHYKKESGELKCGDTSLPKTTTYGSSDANIVTRSRSKWSHDSEFKRGMPEHRSNAESLSQNIESETELPSICGMEGDNSKEKSGGISKVETVGEAVQAASSMTHNSVNEVHNSFVSELDNLKAFFKEYYKETGLEERDIHRRAGKQTMFESIDYAVQYSLNLVEKPPNEEPDSKPEDFEMLKGTSKSKHINASDKKQNSLASGEIENKISCISKETEVFPKKDDEKTTQAEGKKNVSTVAKYTQGTLKEPLKKTTMNEPLPKVKKSRRKRPPMKLTIGKHNARRELLPMETQSANSELHLEERTSSEVVTDKTLSNDDFKLPDGIRRKEMPTRIHQMSAAEVLGRDKHGEQSHAREGNKICPPDLDVELPINNCTDENSVHVEKTSPNSEMPHYKKESGELKCGNTSLPKTTTYGSSDANIVTRSRSKWSHGSELERGMPEHRSNAESNSQTVAGEPALLSRCKKEEISSKNETGAVLKVKSALDALKVASSMNHNSLTEGRDSFVSGLYNLKAAFAQYKKETGLDERDMHGGAGTLTKVQCFELAMQYSLNLVQELPTEEIDSIPDDFETLKEMLKNRFIKASDKEESSLASWKIENKTASVSKETEMSAQKHDEKTKQALSNKKESVSATDNQRTSKELIKKITNIESMPKVKKRTHTKPTKDKHNMTTENERDLLVKMKPDLEHQLTLMNSTEECVASNNTKQQAEILKSSSKGVDREEPHEEAVNENPNTECVATSNLAEKTMSSRKGAIRKVLHKQDIREDPNEEEDLGIEECNVEEFLSEQRLNEFPETTTCEEVRNSKETTVIISDVKTVGESQQDASLMTLDSKNEIVPVNKGLDLILKDSSIDTLKTTSKNSCIEESDKKKRSLASGEIINKTSCIWKETQMSAQKGDEKTTQAVGDKKVSLVATDTQRTLKEPFKKITMNKSWPKLKKSRRKSTPMKVTKGKHNTRGELFPMESLIEISELRLEKRKSVEVDTDKTSKDGFKLPTDMRANQMATQIAQMSQIEIPLGRDKHDEKSDAREESKICPTDLNGELPIDNCIDENSVHVVKATPISEIPNYKKDSAEQKCGDSPLPKTTTYESSDANTATRYRNTRSHDSEFKREMPENTSNAKSICQTVASEPALPSIYGQEESNSKNTTGAILNMETALDAMQTASAMTHNSLTEVRSSFASELHNLKAAFAQYKKEIGLDERDMHRRGGTQTIVESIEYAMQYSLNLVEKLPTEELDSIPDDFETSKGLIKNNCIKESDKEKSSLASWQIENKTPSISKETEISVQKHDKKAKQALGNKMDSVSATDNQRTSEELKQITNNESIPKVKKFTPMKLTKDKHNLTTENESGLLLKMNPHLGHQSTLMKSTEDCVASNNSKQQAEVVKSSSKCVDREEPHEEAVNENPNTECVTSSNLAEKSMSSRKGAIRKVLRKEDVKENPDNKCVISNNSKATENSLCTPEGRGQQKCVETTYGSSDANIVTRRKNKRSHDSAIKGGLPEHTQNADSVSQTTTSELGLSSILLLPKMKPGLGHQSTLTNLTQECVAANNSKQQSEITNSSSKGVNWEQLREEAVNEDSNAERVTSSISNLAAEETMSSSKGARRKVPCKQDMKINPDEECLKSHNSTATVISVCNPKDAKQEGVRLRCGAEESPNEERSSSTGSSEFIGDKNKDFSISESFLNDKSFEVAEVLSSFEKVNLEIEKVLAGLKEKEISKYKTYN